MNRITSTPNTAPTEGPFRFRQLIRTSLARRREGSNALNASAVAPWGQSHVERMPCCSPVAAATWLEEIATEALTGCEGASRLLPNVMDHYLNIVRQARP